MGHAWPSPGRMTWRFVGAASWLRLSAVVGGGARSTIIRPARMTGPGTLPSPRFGAASSYDRIAAVRPGPLLFTQKAPASPPPCLRDRLHNMVSRWAYPGRSSAGSSRSRVRGGPIRIVLLALLFRLFCGSAPEFRQGPGETGAWRSMEGHAAMDMTIRARELWHGSGPERVHSVVDIS